MITSVLISALSASSTITAVPGSPGSLAVKMSHTGRPTTSSTVAVTVEVLLDIVVSAVLDVTTAVFEISSPPEAALSTFTTSVNVATAPAASVGIVATIAPVPPTTGVLVVQPAGAVNETKVVSAGIASVSVTF